MGLVQHGHILEPRPSVGLVVAVLSEYLLKHEGLAVDGQTAQTSPSPGGRHHRLGVTAVAELSLNYAANALQSKKSNLIHSEELCYV